MISLIGGDQRGIKRAGTVDSEEMSIIYGTPQKHWCTLPDKAAKEFPYAEVIFSLSTNVSSNHQRKRKKSRGIKQGSVADIGSFWCRGHIKILAFKVKEKGIWYLFCWIKLGWLPSWGEHWRGKTWIIWCFRWYFEIFFADKVITR